MRLLNTGSDDWPGLLGLQISRVGQGGGRRDFNRQVEQ
jgi:hypothetical protein